MYSASLSLNCINKNNLFILFKVRKCVHKCCPCLNYINSIRQFLFLYLFKRSNTKAIILHDRVANSNN